MTSMNMTQAIKSALDNCLTRDANTVLFGEDVGYFGGVFRCTEGLQAKYGKERIFDTPLSESGIVAIAIGMGINGMRPVIEIQFSDYLFPAFDQITSELAKLRYRSGGEYSAPVTIRAPCGGGIHGGIWHSQSPEAYFTHTPGLKVVIPSNPHDAKGLLISAIEDDDPVIFLEPKRIYNGPFFGDPQASAQKWADHIKGEVDEAHYAIPLGTAEVVRPGKDVTVLAYGTMVHVCTTAIANTTIDAELIDLRSLLPLDIETICRSVNKTGRCVIVHEAPITSGFGAELTAQIQEQCFWRLEAPIVRVAGWDTPYPHAQEWDYFISPARIVDALNKTTRT